MIRSISTAIVGVADQDVMRDFFVEHLGFTVTTDAEMWPGARWLELAPQGGGPTTEPWGRVPAGDRPEGRMFVINDRA